MKKDIVKKPLKLNFEMEKKSVLKIDEVVIIIAYHHWDIIIGFVFTG